MVERVIQSLSVRNRIRVSSIGSGIRVVSFVSLNSKTSMQALNYRFEVFQLCLCVIKKPFEPRSTAMNRLLNRGKPVNAIWMLYGVLWFTTVKS